MPNIDKDFEKLSRMFATPFYKKPWRWVKRQFASIKKVIQWLPIIWGDRDWDYSYFVTIVLHKLKSMQSFYANTDKTYSLGSEKIAREITEVVDLIEKLVADNYEELIDPTFNNWIYEQDSFTKEVIDENGHKHSYFNSPEWSVENIKHREAVYKEAERQIQEDIEKAVKLITKNIRNWWD